jgi:putative flippase GtrA
MALVASDLYGRVRHLGPELLKFGIVGGIGSVVDLGGAALLHGKFHVEPLAAKAISTGSATVITYLGSRFWTFRHRENQELKREAVLFIVLNVVGLLIAEAVVGIITYVMGQHSQIAYNIASFLGTGCGTVFRYFAYKKWVFLAPEEVPSALVDSSPRPFPDYPPWELDPSFLRPLEPAAVPAPVMSAPPAAAHRAAAPHAAPPHVSVPHVSVPHGSVPHGATPDFPTPDFPTPDFPAAAFFAPLEEPRRPAPPPAPPRAPAPPRSSGGGRHRKS